MLAPAAVALPVLLAATTPAAEVRVTYLANEGVHIDGSCSVLVDAVLRDSLGSYARHDPGMQEKLEKARPPYDRVEAVLATHYHLDHWDPGAIAEHLAHNPEAVYASTPEATGMMPYSVRERVKPLWPADGASPVTLQVGATRIDALPLVHGNRPNLAYRIHCGGLTLAHLGDADPSETNFARLLAAGPVDVALVPYWWLLEPPGTTFVKDRWKPRHVIAFHFGGDDLPSVDRVLANVPGAWAPTKAGESRGFRKGP
jgi:L-ascorbate metabolism protein UlaG (beta-lactamase superfamily)